MTFASNKVLSQPDIWDLRGISIQLGEWGADRTCLENISSPIRFGQICNFPRNMGGATNWGGEWWGCSWLGGGWRGGGNCQYGIRGIRGVGGRVTLGSIHGSDLSSTQFIPLLIFTTIHPSTTILLFAKYVHFFFGHYHACNLNTIQLRNIYSGHCSLSPQYQNRFNQIAKLEWAFFKEKL